MCSDMKQLFIHHSQQLGKTYQNFSRHIKKYDRAVDYTKIGILFTLFIFSIFSHLYFVNTSSTRGWYFRQEMKTLDKVQFDYNIIALDIAKSEKQLRQNMTIENQKNPSVEINNTIVSLPITKELTYQDHWSNF